MARVRKSSDFKIVKRIINGKKFESIRPTNYSPTKKPAAIKRHLRFNLTVRLASLLKGMQVLYECWGKAKLEGTRGYNRIISYNYKNIAADIPTESVMITPPGFKPPFEEICFSEGSIRIKFEDGFNPTPDKDYLAVVMIPFDPKEKMKVPYEIHKVHFCRIFNSEPLIFNLKNFRSLSQFNRFFIYTSVVRKTPKKLTWSSTHVISGEL